MTLRGPRADIALALALTAASQVELLVTTGVEGPALVQHLCFGLMTGSLAWRRARPVWCVAGVALGLTAQTLFAGTAPIVGGLVAAIVGTYSVAAHASGSRNLAAGAFFVAFGVVGSGLADEAERSVGDFAGNLLIFGVIFALGLVVRGRRDAANALRGDLAAERRRAEEAVAAERSRIARELHDVIAHHVSAMTLQAGAARQVLRRDPSRVREPLEVVEEHGRRAMDEMRRLLGILREDAPAAADGHAQPSLRGLGELAERMRRLGVPVAIRVSGDEVALPAGVDLAAYRIVQEALTNTLKHSGGGSVSVDLAYANGHVDITVDDDGRGSADAQPGGQQGHGLIGMRERAALYDGRLEAGPGPDGGFRVHARLPVDPAARA